MKRSLYTAMLVIATGYAACGFAQDKPALDVKLDGIDEKGFIKPEYAFCAPDGKARATEGENKSLGVSWSKGPEGTKSYAIIMVDPDVPTVFDDAGKEGKTISANLPRKQFFHWGLFDIAADRSVIPAGVDSNALNRKGKSELRTPYGARGINDYAGYFAAIPERKGTYAGYDGPCPPWNDERVHHYHVMLYALDVPSLGFAGNSVGDQLVWDAAKKHALASGEAIGKYSLNPKARE